MNYLKNIFCLLFMLLIFQGCSQVRESAGVNRKSIDEYQAIESPPLIIPPDFSLVPPEQLQQKNIDNTENELAQEILFGIEEENTFVDSQNSTMDAILNNADVENTPDDIRKEIDENFAQEKSTKKIFDTSWKKEVDVLDAVQESSRIREKNFNNESITDGEVPIKKETIEIKKKKKRFFFF